MREWKIGLTGEIDIVCLALRGSSQFSEEGVSIPKEIPRNVAPVGISVP
jgi:hypothetical protein